MADLYATMLMRWSRNMPRPATQWPALSALAARVKARPAWKKLCAIEGLTDWT
jgi:glutathione S-transferase